MVLWNVYYTFGYQIWCVEENIMFIITYCYFNTTYQQLLVAYNV